MNKAKQESQEAVRAVRREMARHSVDCGEVTVSVTHGIVYLHGKVRPTRGNEDKFEEARTSLLKSLRQRQGVRDVVTDWTVAG